MNDPNKPNEPQRVSNPEQTPPMETPPMPATEYEKNVPHAPDQSTAMSQSGKGGEGSYEGTKQYQEGYKKFSQQTSPNDAIQKANKINPNDPSLKQAEQQGKQRVSAPSIH